MCLCEGVRISVNVDVDVGVGRVVGVSCVRLLTTAFIPDRYMAST